MLGVGQGLAQGHSSTTAVCHLLLASDSNQLSHLLLSSAAILLNFHSSLLLSSLGETGYDINQDQIVLIVSTGLDL